MKTAQPRDRLRSEPGGHGRGAGDETGFVLVTAGRVHRGLSREQQRSNRVSGFVEKSSDGGELVSSTGVAFERGARSMPISAHAIATAAEDRTQSLVNGRGGRSGCVCSDPDRQPGVDEARTTGMQSETFADSSSYDLRCRSAVEFEERIELIVEADREGEQQLAIPSIEFEGIETPLDGRHERERSRQRTQAMTLRRRQRLHDLPDRGGIRVEVTGEAGEHMRRASEVESEEFVEDQFDRCGRDEETLCRVRTLDADPPSFAGCGPAKPSVSKGDHSASSSVR
ncbi:hypothetical protein ACI2IP_17180 [Microbacterium sp. NPDC090218]